jgi:multiple sugar transport system ATP-binding protein
MNFFDATVRQADGGLVIDTSSFQLHIPKNKAEPYREYVGQNVIFGIRPEAMHDKQYQPPDITPAEIQAQVDVVEQMGNEMIVHLQTENHNFIARTDPRTAAHVGGTLNLALNLDNMHIFDAQNELSLAYEHKLKGNNK